MSDFSVSESYDKVRRETDYFGVGRMMLENRDSQLAKKKKKTKIHRTQSCMSLDIKIIPGIITNIN